MPEPDELDQQLQRVLVSMSFACRRARQGPTPLWPQESMNIPKYRMTELMRQSNDKKWQLVCEQVKRVRLMSACSLRNHKACSWYHESLKRLNRLVPKRNSIHNPAHAPVDES